MFRSLSVCLFGLLVVASGLLSSPAFAQAFDSIEAQYRREQQLREQQTTEEATSSVEAATDAELNAEGDGYEVPAEGYTGSYNEDPDFSAEGYARNRPAEQWQQRGFSNSKLRDYNNTHKYQYDARWAEAQGQKPDTDGNWLDRWLDSISSQTLKLIWDIFVYSLITLVVILLFWTAFRMSPALLFRKKGTQLDTEAAADPNAQEQDLLRANFSDPIREAVAAGDFRLAVRLQYLDTLRALARQGIIRWRRDKTNHEYLTELAKTPDIRQGFAALTRRYEYSWYGEFPLSGNEYTAIADDFERLKIAIQAERRPLI